MDEQSPQLQRLTLINAFCIAAYSPLAGRGWALALPTTKLTQELLASALLTLEGKLASSAQQLEFKLIGSASALAFTRAFLARRSIVPIATATKQGQKLEILYYVTSGRLRVAVIEASSAASLTSAPREENIAPNTAEGHPPKPALVTLPSVQLTAASANQAKAEGSKIRVLIVDDSATIRALLTRLFANDDELVVVAAAEHPALVEDLIIKHRPNVLTLDIHMPDMDGVTLLKKLLPRFKLPAVMITSISAEEGPLVLEALEAGAVDYIQKPSLEALAVLGPQIIERVKNAARAKVIHRSPQAQTAPRLPKKGMPKLNHGNMVAIGSSTGGTEALKEILTRLPDNIPPILIVQHIPPIFSLAFAKRLNDLCSFEVKEAEDGDRLLANQVLIAPGGKHMRLLKSAGSLKVRIEETPLRNRHRPSVDVLFESVAELVGSAAIGIILTGMGNDGAAGLLKMREAGARTIAQDEASCAVFGMPREAIKLGGAESILDLFKIPDHLLSLINRDSPDTQKQSERSPIKRR